MQSVARKGAAQLNLARSPLHPSTQRLFPIHCHSTRCGLAFVSFEFRFVLLTDVCFSAGVCSTTFFNFGVARFALLFRKQDDKAYVPQQNYMLIATTYVGAMYGSSTALKFVSYPTQVSDRRPARHPRPRESEQSFALIWSFGTISNRGSLTLRLAHGKSCRSGATNEQSTIACAVRSRNRRSRTFAV